MDSELLLGVRTPASTKMSIIKLGDINFKENKIKDIRNEAANKTNLQKDAFGK